MPKKIRLETYKAPSKVRPRSDIKKDRILKKKINDATQSIRKKYLALKMGKAEEDDSLNRLFKPIIEPLHDIKKNMNTSWKNMRKQQQQQITTIEPKPQPSTSSTSVNFLHTQPIGEILSRDNSEEEEEEEEPDQTFEDVKAEYDNLIRTNKPVLDQYLEQFPPLSRYYIEGFFTNKESYDETSGARFDFSTNKLYIGNKELAIGNNNELVIDGRPYTATKGLYELIFMKNPQGYNDNDLKNYKEILELSNAHKRNYESKGQIKGTRYFKHKRIIQPLFASKRNTRADGNKSGGGIRKLKTKVCNSKLKTSRVKSEASMMVYNEKPIEYVYWDDVNELVDRLKLLIASKSAGNTDSHDNEILAILSELREIGIIA